MIDKYSQVIRNITRLDRKKKRRKNNIKVCKGHTESKGQVQEGKKKNNCS